MTFNEYQDFTRELAAYPVLGHPVVYPALALTGEAGEVANAVKKALRDVGQITSLRRHEIALELGDVLWYVAALAHELSLTLDDVAELNKAKLLERRKVGQGKN